MALLCVGSIPIGHPTWGYLYNGSTVALRATDRGSIPRTSTKPVYVEHSGRSVPDDFGVRGSRFDEELRTGPKGP